MTNLQKQHLTGTAARIQGLQNDINKEQKSSRRYRHQNEQNKAKVAVNEFKLSEQQQTIRKLEKEIKNLKGLLSDRHSKYPKSTVFEICKKSLNDTSAKWLVDKLSREYVGCTANVIVQSKEIIDNMNQQQMQKERKSQSFILHQALEYYDIGLSHRQLKQIRNATSNQITRSIGSNGEIHTRFTPSKWSNGYRRNIIIQHHELSQIKNKYLKNKQFESNNSIYSDPNDDAAEYCVFDDPATNALQIYQLLVTSKCTEYAFKNHLINIEDSNLNRFTQSALCLMWDGSTSKRVHNGSHITMIAAKFSGWTNKLTASPKTSWFILISNRSEDEQITNQVISKEIDKISQIRHKQLLQIEDALGRIHKIAFTRIPIIVCNFFLSVLKNYIF